MNKYSKHLKKLAKVCSLDCWNLDVEIAVFLIPRLKSIKKNKQGVPFEYCGDNYTGQSKEEFKESIKIWHKDLDIMIETFKLIEKGEYIDKHSNKSLVEGGLQLFVKNIGNLWT